MKAPLARRTGRRQPSKIDPTLAANDAPSPEHDDPAFAEGPCRPRPENGDWLRVFEVPVPDFDGADAESRVAGNGDRHIGDSEPVPVPSSYPFFVHPLRTED
jgi:hypothetical protein